MISEDDLLGDFHISEAVNSEGSLAKQQSQKEYIKAVLSICQTNDERRQIFFDFARDLDYPRHLIVQAFKEAGVNDDMSLQSAPNKDSASSRP